jgi:hypothetical protein
VEIPQGSPLDPSGPGAISRGPALDAVKLPAIFLMIAAALAILGGLLGLLTPRVSEEPLSRIIEDPSTPEWVKNFGEAGAVGVGYASNILAMVVGAVILFGALKMLRLQNYFWAMAASILAVIPCLSPCCCLGIPFGIWSLVVLSKPEVKSAFA